VSVDNIDRHEILADGDEAVEAGPRVLDQPSRIG
jgi:hypothetical protein